MRFAEAKPERVRPVQPKAEKQEGAWNRMRNFFSLAKTEKSAVKTEKKKPEARPRLAENQSGAVSSARVAAGGAALISGMVTVYGAYLAATGGNYFAAIMLFAITFPLVPLVYSAGMMVADWAGSR